MIWQGRFHNTKPHLRHCCIKSYSMPVGVGRSTYGANGSKSGLVLFLFLPTLHHQDESSLMADLGFLAHLPELCDVTFMVGPDKVKTNFFKRKLFTVPIIYIYNKKVLIFLYLGLTIKCFLASLTVLSNSRIRDFVELV